MAEDSKTLEERIDGLEKEIDDMETHVVSRIEAIQNEQDQLDEGLNRIIENIQEQGEVTPHIGSVESLYHRVQEFEEDIGQMRESLEDVIEDSSQRYLPRDRWNAN